MVLFKHVLIDKKDKIVALKNLKFDTLCQVMNNGNWNTINLENDRILYYDKTNLGKYGEYDINVLKDSEEIIRQAILFQRDIKQIEDSIKRKTFLLNNLFTKKTNADKKSPPDSSYSSTSQQPIASSREEPVEEVSAETRSIIYSKDDQAEKVELICSHLSEYSTELVNEKELPLEIRSIVELADNEASNVSFEQFDNIPQEFTCQQLEDDEEFMDEQISDSTSFHIPAIENQQQFSAFENAVIENLRTISKQVEYILLRLDRIDTRLTTFEQGMELFYEKHSVNEITKLLNELYLIEIQSLDRRILSSCESRQMLLFFQFVGFQFEKNYCHRWYEIRYLLGMSLHPKSIEFHLLGFGRLNKMNKQNQFKQIESPMKPQDILLYGARSSYATFNCINNQNMVIVFEATIEKILFTPEILKNINKLQHKDLKSIKMLIRKLCQLERQIFFLAYYYSISLHQFFVGLILFELYRDPSISPPALLKELMAAQLISDCLPLLTRLYKLDQFILTY